MATTVSHSTIPPPTIIYFIIFNTMFVDLYIALKYLDANSGKYYVTCSAILRVTDRVKL
jgi:hypothetical protein